MLSKSNRETDQQLECSFPLGVGIRQLFSVQLNGCQNPLCDCQLILLELDSVETTSPIQQLGLTLDLSEKTMVREEDVTDGVYDSFINDMDYSDWELLNQEYYAFKARVTLTADLDKLEPAFPIYDVEETSVLIGYEEVLPFQPVISFEFEGSRYLAMDLYCVNRSCHCSQVHLSIVSDDKDWSDKDDFLLAINLKTGKHKVETQTGQSESLNPSDIMHEVLKVIDIKELGQRYKRIRKWYLSYFDRTQVQGKLIDSAYSAPSNSAKTIAAVGRNDSCPCGSGKKYKKCCLN